MDSEYLNPWYAIEREENLQEVYNRPVSAVFIYVPKPDPKPSQPEKNIYRPASLVLMELAVKARKDVQDHIPFQWPDDFYHDLCTSWFEKQKTNGLADIAYLCGDEILDAIGKFHEGCLVCWYYDGKATAFIPGTVDQGQTPVLNPVDLKYRHYQKPEFPDNGESFKQALQAIADYAPFPGWKKTFEKGLAAMQDSPSFSGQDDTFYIPEPFFKYLYAAQVAQLGSGMGSWFDLPITGTESFKKITNQFSTERDKAIMYAINNC